MKKALVFNSFSGIVQFLVNGIITFVTIPILIHKLGTVQYGIFAIISVIGNLNILANLGLNYSLIKFLAEQGKVKESDYDIVVTLFLLILILFPITFLGLIFKKYILINILNIPLENIDVSSIFFSCLLISNVFILLGNTFGAIINAKQKTYINNLLQLLYSLIYWGSVITILWLNHGLDLIGFAILLTSIVWFVIITIISIHIWGGLPSLKGINANFKRIVKKQFSYGTKIYTTGLIAFFYEPITKILISNLIGISEVGFFEIALKLRTYVISIFSKAFQPLYPLFAELKNTDQIRKYVHDITQKSFFISILLIVILIYVAESFIQLWIGHDVQVISKSVIYIAGMYLLTSISTPNYHFLMAKNHVTKAIYMQLLTVVVNSLVIISTFKFLEYDSIILGNATAIFAAFSLNIYYQKRLLNSLIFDSFHQLFKIIFIFFILLGIGYITKYINLSSKEKLIFIPILLSITFIILFRTFRILKEVDLERYFSKKNILYKMIKKVLIC